ncbi:hypothetical protein MET9862_03518 [Methylobacterium symbioticum]|uniref:Uncharacterized protein n=1 Tax=Methylobacterium symbioticum TaxID=2584084 RepID=A0A509EFE3_9HYPH|nr:hypothetical protein MET9862_03518 [Methylobacterium symbioticum]
MPRFIAALLVLCAPALAAPAHRQPTPDSLRSGTEAASAGREGAAAGPSKPKGPDDGGARSRDWDRTVRRSLGGVCRGC